MKMRLLLAAALCGAMVVGSLIAEDKKDEASAEFHAKCPVSGAPAKETSSLAYKGKKVFFCCDNCPKAFEADPAKFATKANAQLLQTGQIVQVACPLTGAKINPETAIEVGGASVAFCCNNCKGKVEKADADEQLTLVFAKLDKGFTLQTECPVSGEKIDPKSSVEYKGKKVYFCCDGCPAAFEKDPEKYLAKLPQFSEESEEEAAEETK